MRYFNRNHIFASIDHAFVLRCTIQYRYDGSPYLSGLYNVNINGDPAKKLVACGYGSSDEDMIYDIKRKCQYNSCFMDTEPRPNKSSIFIAPECSIPRDLLRPAYNITRSRDNADRIVIPEPVSYGTSNAVAMFLFNKDGNEGIVIVDISLYDDSTKYCKFPCTKDEFIALISPKEPRFIDENVEEIFIMDYNDSFDNTKYTFKSNRNRVVYFLNRCEDYIEILADPTTRCHKYILQHRIKYDAPVKISSDVLQIWEHMDDEDLLSRNIVASDWIEYPITTCIAIANSRIGKFYTLSDYNKAFQDVLKTLNVYDTIKKLERRQLDFSISPKDLDMVQQYLFDKIGVTEDKVFVNHETFMKLKSHEQALIRSRFAVARARTTEDKPLCDIIK